jgi:hypothetical protein
MPIVRITLPAEKRALREKMRTLGLGHREVAAEFARRYRLRAPAPPGAKLTAGARGKRPPRSTPTPAPWAWTPAASPA